MKTTKLALIGALLLALLAGPALAAEEKSGKNRCANGRSKHAAMWLSILHPGVGEYYLKGWGAWSEGGISDGDTLRAALKRAIKEVEGGAVAVLEVRNKTR